MKDKEKTRRHILKAILLIIKNEIPDIGEFILDSTDFIIYSNYARLPERVFWELSTRILGQENKQKYSVYVEIPLNWWYHLVEDHFPKWYKKRWSIKVKQVKRTIEFNHRALMPQINYKQGENKIVMYTEPPTDTGVIKTE